MRCDAIEPLIEAIADGSHEPSADDRAHLTSCAVCAGRLEQARRIEQLLAARELPVPPASFTAAVMARLSQETWKTERVVDLGFNLAVAAGLLVIAAGGAGVAWSLGLLTIDLDLVSLLGAATSRVDGRVMNQLQTVAIAAALLTTALVLWWWAEAATD